MIKVLLHASVKLSQTILIAKRILELHILAEDQLHLLWLLVDLRQTQASLKQMPSLSLIALTSAMLDLHVHVDRPDVHPLRVVAHDSFKHGSTVLRISILELKHAKLRDHINVVLLWQGLQSALENCLWSCEIISRRILLAVTHVKEELNVA